MTNVRSSYQEASHKQKREYEENGYVRGIHASHCGHCEKEYSESQFWWTISDGNGIEVHEGFWHSHYTRRDCYFCSEDCVRAAVGTLVAAVTDDGMRGRWGEYVVEAFHRNIRALKAERGASQPLA
jgi:hypothetical protein